MRLLATILCAVTAHTACAQIRVIPIPHSPGPASPATNAASRTKATQSLPFWDDFSEAVGGAPSEERWFAGKSTWVNDGLAINPPSIFVASFDGVDSVGKPYSVNDVLAKGFADKLESHPIDLAVVPAADRASVYISFYYQMKGLGELPDGGDKLVLEFRTADNKWEETWAMENTGTQPLDVFTQIVLPIADKFFHSAFKFRFKNFARLSGPYDTWHVDYIYLNTARTATDTSYPDRSVVTPLTSAFKNYHALPKEHFFVDKDEALTNPSVVVHNLRTDAAHVEGQPVTYFSYAQVEKYTDGFFVKSPLTELDSAAPVGLVKPLEYMTAEVAAEGLSDLLDEDADSIHLWLKVALQTKDNLLPAEDGDYNLKYAPMDFRDNDTTRSDHWISSYYAYDDGTAEYGAALNQPGAQVAYEFNLVGVDEGYINALQLFFPRFGDETQQVIELRIWSDLLEQDASVLYKEVVTLQRSEQNVFWRKKLTKAVKVGERFYVGWKQSSIIQPPPAPVTLPASVRSL